jgi:hypothetical protein
VVVAIEAFTLKASFSVFGRDARASMGQQELALQALAHQRAPHLPGVAWRR